MLAALILAAGAAAPPARNIDQRVALVEARQMLQSQTVWQLQAALPPEAAKALTDLDLHLQQDRERDEKMSRLESTVATLEQRLQAVELLLGDRTVGEGSAGSEGAPMRVARTSPQIGAVVLPMHAAAKPSKLPRSKRAQAPGASRQIAAGQLSAQLP